MCNRLHSWSILTGLAALTLLGSPALADEPNTDSFADMSLASDNHPAVSGLNGQVAVRGGWLGDSVNETGMTAISGSFALPLGDQFGFQGDTLLAFSHGEFGGGAAGHLFWRDPSVGMAGIFGQWIARHQPNWKTWRAGIEGQAYFGSVTFGGIVGYEMPQLPAQFADQDDIFAIADLSYYFNDNTKLSVGYRYLNGANIGAVDFEIQPEWTGWGRNMSLFAEGRVGEYDYAAVWGGLRWHFGGQSKSLIQRHRQDGVVDTEKESIFQVNIDQHYN